MTSKDAARELIDYVLGATEYGAEQRLAAAVLACEFGIPLYLCDRCGGEATDWDDSIEQHVCIDHVEGSMDHLDPLDTTAAVLAEAGLDPAELRSERVQAGESGSGEAKP